jgi:hypothetical protein
VPPALAVVCQAVRLSVRFHYWRLRLRWEDNIKVDLQEVGGGDSGQGQVAALVSTVKKLRVS